MGFANDSATDSLFNSEGYLKQKIKVHPDFIRPLYQYTSSEIRNWQREEKHPEDYWQWKNEN